jgi:hypothetical protein
MAIIRNERARNREPEAIEEPEVEEEEIDYDWHPTEDEFVSPITAEQWAELLSSPKNASAVSDVLAPAGETALSLLEGLLKEDPNSEAFKRAYVRLAMMPARNGSARPDAEKAAAYAQELLSASAVDSELIMLFLSARDRYAH